MNDIRKLPIGIQDFEKLRTNGYVYVDKTRYAYELASQGAPYFLGRPRRFGKSLFLSTLKAYFQGKKELFDGLAIAELEKDWIEYPVIYIDLNLDSYSNAHSLYVVLDSILDEYEQKCGMKNVADSLPLRFSKLIKQAYEKSGRKVVVLVDEYDKPLLGTIEEFTINDEIRTLLKGFYGVLKSSDAYLRFVFLTGVTKFSKVSVFSDLNQLDDISLDKKYAAICGITQAELVQYFEPEIRALAADNELTYEATLARLKKLYDGYHFDKDGEGMYNPFSLLLTFSKKDFGKHWFGTGTPTFLAKMVQHARLINVKSLEGDIRASVNFIDNYRVDMNDPVPLLYQSGYLTIKRYDKLFDEFILGFPNEEVKYGFLRELMRLYMPKTCTYGEFDASNFVRDLYAGNVDGFMNRMKAFFAAIPYELNNREEKHFQTIFYVLLTLMGQFVEVEVSSALGRADAVVKTPVTIYVFEFKITENATAEEALQQIDERGYAKPYALDSRPTVKVGVEFSLDERGVKRWIME